MKKLFITLILAALFTSSLAFSQNLFDSRFMLGNSASLKLDHFHDWEYWTSFVEVSPTGKYALLEFGPKFNFPGGALKLRAGLNISVSSSGAKYVDQQALVFFIKREKFQFLSVNEIKDIGKNNPFHWSANQYYYEHDLKYGRFAAHLEAVWWEKNYKPFTGPTLSFPVGRGNLVVWPG
ncbi:MAG: hypothetical protein PHR36_04205 [Patescibacteria group bacterium]|nr:hypothetical protein [Patescibacteria group bacterium]